jgi:hypothetical protein
MADRVDPLGFRYIDYAIRMDAVDIAAPADRSPRDGWTPEGTTGDLFERLPQGLPPAQLEARFAPESFTANAYQLAHWTPPTAGARAARDGLVEQLYERLLISSTLQGSARFVVLHEVPGPWTSAHATGCALAGLAALFEAFGDDRYQTTAREFLAGLTKFANPQRGGFWVSRIDDDGYLWLEMIPAPNKPQPRVMRGHVHAVSGLYQHFRVFEAPLAERLLRGAITTVRHHVEQFRVPGDDGPERIADEQRALAAIAGDPFFEELAAH